MFIVSSILQKKNSFFLTVLVFRTLTQRTNETTFHDLVEPPVSRSVTLNNGLPFGIAIWNVSVAPNAMGSFTVSSTVIPSSKLNQVVKKEDYINQIVGPILSYIFFVLLGIQIPN